ncbi:MAG: hypothetical protein ABSD99_06125 [Candidatus Bathyarchaeia archaeon]
MPFHVIEASNLVKYYRKKKEPAIDNLNLAIDEGKIFTLLEKWGWKNHIPENRHYPAPTHLWLCDGFWT